MIKISAMFAGAAAVALWSGAAGLAAVPGAPVVRVVSTLSGYSYSNGFMEGSPGAFYVLGKLAPSGLAAVFSVTSKGSSTTTLASFPAHAGTSPGIVGGANGLFYSSIQYMYGAANAFSVSSAANSLQVYPSQPYIPGLTQALPNGAILGLAANAANLVPYSVSTVSLAGVITLVYDGFNDWNLVAGPIYASDGNYYGAAGGSVSSFAYKVTPSGGFTSLYTFPSPPLPFGGGSPGGFLQGSDGNFYGTLPSGGANATGAVYKLTPGGQYTLLHSFPYAPDGGPTTLLQASDGNLYGATQGYVAGGPYGGSGLLFRVTTAGQYAQLYAMGGAVGSCPCKLLQGSDGLIYGTSNLGGKSGGGTLFSLDVGRPKPKPQALQFTPASGAAGTQAQIWGYNLLAASVKFNGTAATNVSSSGPNYVLATVPAGATTGPITVTTPGGTSTTTASFTVN
jgi:uncharacterized repeat protein (TIGR03803 family)